MKKLLSALLSICLIMCLFGCHQESDTPQGTPFYYCKKDPSYQEDSTALTAEYRTDALDQSFNEVMEIYLQGPQSAALYSPFPDDLRLIGVHQENGVIYLTFSRELSQLSGLSLTMACSCITLTALTLTGANQAEIRCVTGLLDGQRSIIMDKDTLLLLDTAS